MFWVSSQLSSMGHTGESMVHRAAKKAGISLGCDLQFLDLPMCSGYDSDGSPKMTIQPWPFVLPSDLVSQLV